jgi:spore germination cell wall hydrolase CwlJ-like protein
MTRSCAGSMPATGLLGAFFLACSIASADAAPSKVEILQPIFRSYLSEIECLAKAVYFEARGEPIAGQRAVARVILNRVDSPYYPHTICEVVFQNSHMRNACQFSFACDGTDIETIGEPRAFERAKTVAVASFRCDSDCRSRRGSLARSTHFHADYVNPWWSDRLELMGQIGRHIFYYTSTR